MKKGIDLESCDKRPTFFDKLYLNQLKKELLS